MGDEQEVHLENGDRVVVEPWDGAPAYRTENLILLNEAGAIQWRARLPDHTGPDCFVAIASREGVLVATTWSGYRVELDPISGKQHRATFVK